MKRYYISMPMAGHSLTHQRECAALLRCLILEKDPCALVIDPLMLGEHLRERYGALEEESDYLGYNHYIAYDIYFLLQKCDAIVMADGWEESRGCRLEHEAAHIYGKEIIYQPTI